MAIETIDRIDISTKIIGFAYFPLFLTTDGKASPSRLTQSYLMTEGCYQIPIYYTRVNKELNLEAVLGLPKM